MTERGRIIARDLTVRYVAVLTVLGILAVAAFAGLAQALLGAQGAPALINTAGRQRMLVEKAALLATMAAETDHGAAERGRFAVELEAVAAELEAAHVLLAGASPPPSVRSLYSDPAAGLDAAVAAFVAEVRTAASRAAAGQAPDEDVLHHLQADARGPLVAGLDLATQRYEAEHSRRLERLVTYHGGALAATLLLLGLSAFGVFRPMVARLRADYDRRAKAERQARDSEERLWTILDESPFGVSVSRKSDGVVVFANARFCEIVEMERGELVGSQARERYVDEVQRRDVIARLKEEGRIDEAEVEFRKKDGTPFWTLLTLRPTQFRDEPVNLAWVYDVTRRRSVEEQLRLAAKVVETASEGVLITDARNEIAYVNPAFTTITEYTLPEVIGRNPAMLSSGRHDEEFYRQMWEMIERDGRWRGEVWNRRKSGEFYAEWLSIVVVRDKAGAVTNHIAVFSDITHRKEDERKVWRQANYDALTGLPNRALFLDRLVQSERQARRDGKGFALMFLDLDGFKAVNDNLGHAAGDVLLQQAAQRLSDCVRASDTVARLAGDEFTIILPGVRGRDECARVAAKILEGLAEPFTLDVGTGEVHASIGIALFPEDGEDGAALLAKADAAMYAVKKAGKNGYRFAGDG